MKPNQSETCGQGRLNRIVSISILLLGFIGTQAFSVARCYGQQQKPSRPSKLAALDQLIDDLSSPHYLIRENSRRKLLAARQSAYRNLQRRRDSGTLESRLLIREILSQTQVDWVLESDKLAIQNLMTQLPKQEISRRLAIVEKISGHPTPDAWRPLLRIAQWDSSSIIRRQAIHRALSILIVRDQLSGKELQTFTDPFFQSPDQLARRLDSDTAELEHRLLLLGMGFARFPEHPAAQNWLDSFINSRQRSQTNGSENVDQQYNLHSELQLMSNRFRIGYQFPQFAKPLDELAFVQLQKRTLRESLPILIQLRIHRRWKVLSRADELIQFSTQPGLAGFLITEGLFQSGKQKRAMELADQILDRWAAGNVLELTGVPLEDIPEELDQMGLSRWSCYVVERFFPPGDLSPANQLWLARRQFQSKQFLKAEELCRSIIKASAASAVERSGAYLILAEMSQQKERLKESIGYLEKAVAVNPQFTEALIQLNAIVNSKQLTNDPDLEKSRRNSRQRSELAIGYYRDQLRLAIQQRTSELPAIAERGEINAPVFARSLARLLIETGGDRQEALRNARLAVEWQPNNRDAMAILAICLAGIGDSGQARKIQRQIVFQNPLDDEARKKLDVYQKE